MSLNINIGIFLFSKISCGYRTFFALLLSHNMSRRKPKTYDSKHLVDAIKKWPNPIYDKRHGYYLYVVNKRRAKETRIEHIVQYRHNLSARDLELVPNGIINYFDYKKDPTYKNTYSYYIKRGGMDKGFVKVSIRIDDNNPNRAWIKTIFITYKLK